MYTKEKIILKNLETSLFLNFNIEAPLYLPEFCVTHANQTNQEDNFKYQIQKTVERANYSNYTKKFFN